MSISSAFNEITVAHGGTASTGGAITAAIDALNDALAGSDQPKAKTIEGAVRLLGEHIGGGASTVKCYVVNADNQNVALTNIRVYDTLPSEGMRQVQTYIGELQTPEGSLAACCFDARCGNPYTIVGPSSTVRITGGELMPTVDTAAEFPVNLGGDGAFYITAPCVESVIFAEFSSDPEPDPNPNPK